MVNLQILAGTPGARYMPVKSSGLTRTTVRKKRQQVSRDTRWSDSPRPGIEALCRWWIDQNQAGTSWGVALCAPP
jgi:hypothetical protein